MGFLSDLLSRPYPSNRAHEVDNLMQELYGIGREQDYLSEHPGGGFNSQCRHVRAKEIGKKLYEIGGIELMHWAHRKVRKNVSKIKAEHLEYAWDGIGTWQA